MDDKYIFEELTKNDYYYLDFIFQFTNYHYNCSPENFKKYLLNMQQNKLGKIILLKEKESNKIIGAGTILILHKIHNNPIGEIHDVFIDEEYRKLGLGKKIIDYLTNIGLNDFYCYKIILNSVDHNISFYEKCDFQKVGNEMRYCKK
tara:strand:- start:232 stop:672 length:441 start_codon:yes stop_codon:yes gene_type:complete